MKKVVLCNKLGRLKTLLRDGPGPFRYLNLMDTGEGRLMGGLLGQCPDAEEVPRDALFLDRSEDFRKRYVRFMGQLNIGHHSMGWWAMPFTNKNPLSTWLCRNTAYFLLIRDVFGSDPRPLLVLTNSGDLAAQVLAWAGTEGIEAANLVSAPGKMRRLLKLHTPSGILRASLRTIVLWAFSRRYRPARNRGDDHLVITTLTHPRSFAAVGGYRDAYFGNLADYATASGHKPVVLAMVIEQPFQQLRRLKTLQPAVPIVPLEACLSLMAILACTMKSLGVYFRPLRLRGPVEIDGVDLSCLVKRAVNEARHSGDIFLNLRVYFSVRRISQAIRVSRCLYPYENRAWEKMLLLGMKSASPETRLVGYQHASLTLSHTNFMLAPAEAEITPLPDSILTTGRVATEWLEREGNYPQGMFHTACALRQGQPVEDRAETNSSGRTRVLVALATSLVEYVNTLSFLERAFGDVDGYDLRIRPHPEIPLESALAIAPTAGPRFYSESTGALADDLGWADVVLYASSTVGLEAVYSGIPAVYLNLGDFLDTDPMSGWTGFRWSVKEPSELVETIQRIQDLPRDRFQELQQKGRDYVAAYLAPVNSGNIRAFWEK